MSAEPCCGGSPTPGVSPLIELRQAQPQRQPAAHVTVSGDAGCSGLSARKSHRCVVPAFGEDLASDRQGRCRGVSSASPAAPTWLSETPATLPLTHRAGVFAGMVKHLAGREYGFQDAQPAGPSLPAAEPAATPSGASPELGSMDTAPLAAPRSHGGSTPIRAQGPAPAWSVRVCWQGSDLYEIVPFEEYQAACEFFETQLADSEVLSVELTDRHHRLIHDSDERRYLDRSQAEYGADIPGLYRWNESLVTFHRVA